MSFWDPARPKGQEKALRPLKVRRMRALLEGLGQPQLDYASILVAGTKGKGSTCAFVAEGLRSAGYSVGRYTQPHLVDWRERTWVDGDLIRPEEVAAVAERIRRVAEGLQASGESGSLTTYEVGTALTLSYFATRKVDFAVLEIGIGGGQDALNVVDPVLSVITAISFDHTDVLGDTLQEIATEKAGIMRRGVATVSSPQRPEAGQTLRREAGEIGSKLYFVGQDWRWEHGRDEGTIDIVGPHGILRGLTVPLLGDHQRDNATVAVAALQLLREGGVSLTDDAIRRGIASVDWPGRIQLLSRSPLVIADAAHNVDSVERLLETVQREFRYRRMILVFGASAEKDVAGMARVLGPAAAKVIVTSSGHRRAADIHRLAEAYAEYSPVDAELAPETAFRKAVDYAGHDDLILITGSVFLAGKAIQVMSNE